MEGVIGLGSIFKGFIYTTIVNYAKLQRSNYVYLVYAQIRAIPTSVHSAKIWSRSNYYHIAAIGTIRSSKFTDWF